MRKTLLLIAGALSAALANPSFATQSSGGPTRFVGATTMAGSQTGASQTDVRPSSATASGLRASTATVTGPFIPSASNQPGPTNPVLGGNAYLGYGADASGSDGHGAIGAGNTAVGTGAATSDVNASTPGSNNTALGSGATAIDGQRSQADGKIAVGSNA